MTRRQFTKSLGGAVAITALRPLSSWAADNPQISAAAVKLYQNSFVLDCNSLSDIGSLIAEPDQDNIAKMIRESGVTALKSTLGGANCTFEEAVAAIGLADQLMEKKPDLFLNVRVFADFDRAQKTRKLGVIYSFEAASMLEDKIDRIELFRHLGVRVMQLSYNHRSPLGVGCLDGETDGLTELGHKAIARMNETGVALDLSHANTKTTAEGIAASTKPVLITHAGCRAVFMHPRNKEDREMKALADKGGVMGIYMLPFLTPSPKQPMRDDYMKHLEHALKICGEDHVGVGSDVPFFPVDQAAMAEMAQDIAQRKKAGIGAPGEDRMPYIPDLNTPKKMELIADALLQRGYKSTVVEKVLGKNFKRAFGEIWTS